MREIVWTGLAEPSRERCRVDEQDDRVIIAGTIDRADGSVGYELRTDAAWRFEALSITDRTSARTLSVSRSPDGWTVDGRPRPDLAAAREVDLSASPVSNTLPIRRLGLAVGESADLTTAYIAIPGLTVVTDPQRYTRLGSNRWLYESRDSDFRRVITVDDDGLVVDYPGLFARV